MAKNFQSAFVKYYKEKLEPFGFQKVKGRQPYFVRVVNDEILHIFTFKGTASTKQGYKAFHLMCGVATVYRKEINFSVTPGHNSDWMVCLGDFYKRIETAYPTIITPSMKYYYNDENLEEVLEETYDGAKIIIRELDKISNMDEVLRYLLKYDAKNITFTRGLDDSFFDEEGLYYARKEFDYVKIEKMFEDRLLDLKNSGWSNKEKEETKERIFEWEEELKKDRERFISNDKDYEQGMKLLREHYNANIDKLIGYGLNIKRKN